MCTMWNRRTNEEKSAEMELDDAVEQAVSQCIKDGILADFLLKNRSEAIAVSIFEYDEEKELALLREAEREAGVQQGIQKGIQQGIQQETQHGIQTLITSFKEFDIPKEAVIQQLRNKYSLGEEEIARYMTMYW